MKNIISILFFIAGLSLSAQVGINTNSPKAKLDINGDINLRNKIVVLNPADNSLSQGNNDQILVSQGEGYPPIWKSLRIPEYEPNKFYLIFNNSFSDRTGVKFTSTEQSSIAAKNTAFTKGLIFPAFRDLRVLLVCHSLSASSVQKAKLIFSLRP